MLKAVAAYLIILSIYGVIWGTRLHDKYIEMEFPNGNGQSTELLQAQVHVWNHIFNFINSMALKCATQLGIQDIIHNHAKPMSLSELVDALLIHQSKSGCIYRLMRILVHSGFFTEVEIVEGKEEKGYLLTPTSHLLLKDVPLSMTPLLLVVLDPILIDPWHYFSEWFKNADDRNPFVTTHGRTLWEYAAHEPSLNTLFNEAMASDARLVANVVIRDFPQVFAGLNTLVDVGGGVGTMVKAVANTFPKMNVTVLDLPHVVAGLEGTKNLAYVGGDMFESIPPADAVLLKLILHDWSDEESVKILKKCKESIPSKEKGGKVIIIDIVEGDQRGDEKATESQLFCDMLMMVLVAGRERNKDDWAKLFFEAGFSDYNITPIIGLRSVIEVYP